MKVKVVSDGTPKGTSIVNEDTGERIDLPLSSVTWHIDSDGEASLRLVVPLASISAHADLIAIIEGEIDD